MPEIKLPYDAQTPDSKLDTTAFIAKLNDAYAGADIMRRKYEPIVFDNLTFVFGDQDNHAYSDVQRHTRRNFSAARETKVNAKSNQLMPMMRQYWATAIAQQSGNRAQAKAGQAGNREQLKLVNDFLTSRSDAIEEQERRFVEVQEASLSGCVLRWPFWDPNSGRPGLSEGDISSRVLTFWDYLLPHWYKSTDWLVKGAPDWIIVPTVRDIGEIKDMFGVEVKPEDTANADRMLDRIVAMIGRGDEWRSATTAERKSSATLKEMIVPPNARYPKGRYIVWCGASLFRDDPLPDGIVPVPIYHIPIPRYLALTVTEQVINHQKYYNSLISLMLEMVNRQLRCDTIQAGGGGEGPKVVYDSKDKRGPRRIIMPEDVTKFEMLKYEFNPLATLKMMELFTSDAKGNVGQSDPNLARATQGEHTLGELQLLSQSDHNGSNLMKTMRDWAYAKIGLAEWQLAQHYYQNPRELRLNGNRGQDSREFMGFELGEPTAVVPRTMPILSMTDQLQIKQDMRKAGIGADWGGNPEKELSDRLAYLDSGLPDAEELAENGTLPLEELIDVVKKLRGNEIQVQLIASDAKVQAMLAPPVIQPGVIPGQDQGAAAPQMPSSAPQPQMQPTMGGIA